MRSIIGSSSSNHKSGSSGKNYSLFASSASSSASSQQQQAQTATTTGGLVPNVRPLSSSDIPDRILEQHQHRTQGEESNRTIAATGRRKITSKEAMQGLMMHHHHGGVPVQTHLDPLDALLGPFPCVRLRGLPFDATLVDVCILFQGLVILDVLVVGTGEAFLLFSNPMDFSMALQRTNLFMGNKYIEVFQGKRSDYYAAIASQYTQQRVSGGRENEGNPHLHQNQQGNVWQHHGGMAVSSSSSGNMPQQPQRQQQMHNKNHSAAVMQPPSSSHVQKQNIAPSSSSSSQQQQKDKTTTSSSSSRPSHHTGGKTSSNKGTVAAGNRGSGHNRGNNNSGQPDHHGNRLHTHHGGGMNVNRGRGSGGGIQVGEHTGYIRMRGLPFTATKEEIVKFFKNHDPIENSVSLTYRSDGRATGEGYIAFHTPDAAKNAMVLHRNTMGTRYIELFISNKEEHSRAIARENAIR